MKRRTNQRPNRIGMHNLVITVTWYGPLASWGLSTWQCCLLNIPSTAFCTRLRFYKLRNRAARPCSASEYCQHQGLIWSLWLLLCALLLLLQPLMEQQVRRVGSPILYMITWSFDHIASYCNHEIVIICQWYKHWLQSCRTIYIAGTASEKSASHLSVPER